MNLEILHPNIFYYKNVIKNPEGLIDLINSTDYLASEDTLIDKWQPFHAPNRPDSIFGLKKISHTFRTKKTHKELIDLHNIVDGYIKLVSNDYAEKQGIDIGYQYKITYLKYFEKTFLGPHTDSGKDQDGTISCVAYLNDDYLGGELKFDSYGIYIKPEPGSIFVFPSKDPFMHYSLPVKSGNKFLITAFWHENNGNILSAHQTRGPYG